MKEKTLFFIEKIENLPKIIALIIVFVTDFFHYHFLPNFKKLLDFHKLWLIFSGKIFSTSLVFSILRVKFLVAEIVERMNSEHKSSKK